MDRNRDGGEGLMVREWRALTLLVERKVLALTLNEAKDRRSRPCSVRRSAEVLQRAERHEHPPWLTRRRIVGHVKLL